MTPQQIDAMKLALEALKWCHGGEPCGTSEAITAIEESLAEHAMRETQRLGQEIEQEPVAWVSEAVCDGQYIDGRPRKIWWECNKGVGTAFYTRPPQRTEQEPVAYATKEDFHRELERRLKHIREEMKIKSVTMRCKDYDIALPIIDTDFGRVLVGQVSTPPQRKPLTHKEIWNAIRPLTQSDAVCMSLVQISMDEYRAIEAAHGIKENT